MQKMCWSYIDTLVSASPIIQNGKLVGAVTHVLVDDPTRGYGIFIENMLETAQQVADEKALKAAIRNSQRRVTTSLGVIYSILHFVFKPSKAWLKIAISISSILQSL